MFTATKDVMLPTTVTGSWPRPRWYDVRLDGRPLSTRMKDVVFREQLTDALAALLTDQERAGLDILTHGDYFHDEDLGGHAWHRYPLERWSGLSGDYCFSGDDATIPPYRPGSILYEIFAGWRWASRRRKDRAKRGESARVRQDLAPRTGEDGKARQVRHGLGAGRPSAADSRDR